MEKSNRDKEYSVDDSTLDKALLLQEAKNCFLATSCRPKKLIDILTKCIVTLYQGEHLVSKEATDLFFHITQLFQYKDSTLRRLTYIGIKALSQQAENVYVVTSNLTADVNSTKDDPAIRASALRTLSKISDVSIEQYLKQNEVDKNPIVTSTAISSLVRLAIVNKEIAKRFINEIQEALHSGFPMVQYHALGLLYNSYENDRPAVSKLISNCVHQNLKSPLAICLLIRIISNFINSSSSEEMHDSQLDYLASKLDDKSEMVELEAAKALVNMKYLSAESRVRTLAVAHLRNFLTSSRSSLRFSALRTLNELATDSRFWSIHRISNVCKLHLLNKRYKQGEHIIGILDFTNCDSVCAKYTVILQCEETEQYELKHEFCLGTRKNDFMITMPTVDSTASILHCVLSFLFYIVDKSYSMTLYEDRAGTIVLGPSELDTKLFSCDFPIAIYT